jgi:hypothetical protein
MRWISRAQRADPNVVRGRHQIDTVPVDCALGKSVPLDIVFGGASAERDVLRSPEWPQVTLSGPTGC